MQNNTVVSNETRELRKVKVRSRIFCAIFVIVEVFLFVLVYGSLSNTLNDKTKAIEKDARQQIQKIEEEANQKVNDAIAERDRMALNFSELTDIDKSKYADVNKFVIVKNISLEKDEQYNGTPRLSFTMCATPSEPGKNNELYGYLKDTQVVVVTSDGKSYSYPLEERNYAYRLHEPHQYSGLLYETELANIKFIKIVDLELRPLLSEVPGAKYEIELYNANRGE